MSVQSEHFPWHRYACNVLDTVLNVLYFLFQCQVQIRPIDKFVLINNNQPFSGVFDMFSKHIHIAYYLCGSKFFVQTTQNQ